MRSPDTKQCVTPTCNSSMNDRSSGCPLITTVLTICRRHQRLSARGHLGRREAPGSARGPDFVLDDLKIQEWGGLQFPVLADQDALLLQVLHVFQHLLSYWVKPSWLLEIGRFMERRRHDSIFWSKFAQRLEGQPQYAEFATITLELAAKMFAVPLPEAVQRWKGCLRRSARLWLDNYGKEWVLSERPPHRSRVFPNSKLSLFSRPNTFRTLAREESFLGVN